MFTEALFKIARMWSQCKCPSMDAQKKKEILSLKKTWMNLEDVLSEISQTQEGNST
jgi:hypothetical protein